MLTSFVRVRLVLASLFLIAAIAQGQAIVTDQTTMSFTAPVGGSSQAQFLGGQFFRNAADSDGDCR